MFSELSMKFAICLCCVDGVRSLAFTYFKSTELQSSKEQRHVRSQNGAACTYVGKCVLCIASTPVLWFERNFP